MKDDIKILVRGCYDLQKLRIQMGGRIVANYKVKIGQAPGEKENGLDRDKQKVLNLLRLNHKKITDGIKRVTRKNFDDSGVISSYAEFIVLSHYISLEREESRHFKDLEVMLKDMLIWTEFLKGVKGVGPAMAGVIISEIDIEKPIYPSSIWKYAGLDVASDGKGRSRRKEHLIDVEYINKKGEEATRKSITYNPFLKSKLMGVLGPSFLKCKSEYSEHYYYEKTRLENHAIYKDVKPLHRHTMATRKMIKRFLVDLYAAWKALEGLPVAQEYSEAKLGMRHRVA